MRAPEIAGPLTRVGPEIMEPAITGPVMTEPHLPYTVYSTIHMSLIAGHFKT